MGIPSVHEIFSIIVWFKMSDVNTDYNIYICLKILFKIYNYIIF